MSFTPILPKKPVVVPNPNRRLELRMAKLVADVQREATDYEVPDSPNYHRTHKLADSWSREVRTDSGGILGVVKSSKQTAPYNKWVRGVKGTQSKVMVARGWRSITTIVEQYWPDARADFEKILGQR